MAKKLAVFDFDNTLVNTSSELFLLNRLFPKDSEENSELWADITLFYKSLNVNKFSERIRGVLSEKKIENKFMDGFQELEWTPGMEKLVKQLKESGYDIVVASLGSVDIIKAWVSTQKGLRVDLIFGRESKIICKPCLQKDLSCPQDMCKGPVIDFLLTGPSPYSTVLFICDGLVDFCLATRLPLKAHIFVRKGFDLEKYLEDSFNRSKIRAPIYCWTSGDDIIKELLLLNLLDSPTN